MFYCDIRMADLCHPLFGAGKCCTKVLQIVFRDADMTRGVLQTWKDTAFDAGRGTEELPGFYSKEFAAAGYIGTLWFPHFLSTAYLLYAFPVARAF